MLGIVLDGTEFMLSTAIDVVPELISPDGCSNQLLLVRLISFFELNSNLWKHALDQMVVVILRSALA